jgi:hypothetical protein
LRAYTELAAFLDSANDELMYLRVRQDDLLSQPDDDDIANLGVDGFLAATVEQLRNDESAAAQDALRLLYRLVMRMEAES